MNQATTASQGFNAWGILELFGHQRLAGRLSEQAIGGCSFIRIDVPSVGDDMGYTRLFSNGAIYGITITTEDVAKGMAEVIRAKPIQAYELPRLSKSSVDHEAIDEDEFPI